MSKTYNEIYYPEAYMCFHLSSVPLNTDIARQTSSLLTFATKTAITAADTEMRLQVLTTKGR